MGDRWVLVTFMITNDGEEAHPMGHVIRRVDVAADGTPDPESMRALTERIARHVREKATRIDDVAAPDGVATVRRQLDHAIAAALPISGGRTRSLIRALQGELARVDADRAAKRASAGRDSWPIPVEIEQAESVGLVVRAQSPAAAEPSLSTPDGGDRDG